MLEGCTKRQSGRAFSCYLWNCCCVPCFGHQLLFMISFYLYPPSYSPSVRPGSPSLTLLLLLPSLLAQEADVVGLGSYYGPYLDLPASASQPLKFAPFACTPLCSSGLPSYTVLAPLCLYFKCRVLVGSLSLSQYLHLAPP